MIISHYATSYVAFGILVPILLLPFLKTLYNERKFNLTNFDVVIIYLAFIILWFILYAKVQFLAGSEVITATVAATASGAKWWYPRFYKFKGRHSVKCFGE